MFETQNRFRISFLARTSQHPERKNSACPAGITSKEIESELTEQNEKYYGKVFQLDGHTLNYSPSF